MADMVSSPLQRQQLFMAKGYTADATDAPEPWKEIDRGKANYSEEKPV
jgi:hypothetical protein